MKIIVDNLALEYEKEGNGPAVLMLHGWQDSLRTFDTLNVYLKAHFTLVKLDLPGFGQSETPPAPWNLNAYTGLVGNFLLKLRISDVEAIIGHSFGGRVAIKGLATGTLKAGKLVLIASGGISKRRKLRNMFFSALAKMGKVMTFFLPFWRQQMKWRLYLATGSDYLEAGVLRETFIKVIEEDLQDSAKQLALPTLLVWGENDSETPIEDCRIFSKSIKGSQTFVISGAGHFVHQEKTTEVAEAIRKFIV
jgi:pimeloyl-ACP methyl ester carboxylesterase